MPKKNAMATDTNIAMMTCNALSVLMSWPMEYSPSPIVFTSARANVPPSSSNTIETVVDVGRPIVLNTSSSTTSVSITARRMHISSSK